MTDEKTKVKDLATELHVAAKDVMQAMKDLDIPVRNASTVIGSDDLSRIKEHLKNAESADHKESQPGVIVRRRQRPAPQVEVAKNEHPVQEEKASEYQDSIVSIIIQTHNQCSCPKRICIESEGYISTIIHHREWIQVIQINREQGFCDILKQRITTKDHSLW